MNKNKTYGIIAGIIALITSMAIWKYDKHNEEEKLRRKKRRRYAIVFVILAIFIGLFAWYKFTPGPYDALATCLAEKDVKFYGAFWCKNCQDQKQKFAKSFKKINYIECSTPDGKKQLPLCIEAKIEGYPTWVFADETRLVGVQELEKLAEVASCPI